MCGIGGIVWRGGEDRQALMSRTLESLRHRGPDEAGYYIDDYVGLAHTRLTIVDNAGGKQPFHVEGLDQVLIYNGEIFNYEELKLHLAGRGVKLQSHSDTELLFHLLVEFGSSILPRINGQFSFCFYDPHSRTLLLARDAFGEKPLFYTLREGRLAFGSEAKAIVSLTDIPLVLCGEQLHSMAQYWATLPSRSVFKDIEQLPPGCALEFRDGRTNIFCYLVPLQATDADSNGELRELIAAAVRRRMRSDVPVGLMLSGGLDSSIIGAEMRVAAAAASLRSFSVAFRHAEFDERRFQEVMSRHLDTEHEMIEIDGDDLSDAMPDAIHAAEMPSPRTAFVAIHILHRRVNRAGIKVLLSGEGADEMFMGYDLLREVYIKDQIRKGRSFEELESVISTVNSFMPNDENYRRMIHLKFANYRALADDTRWNASHSQRANLAAQAVRLLATPDEAAEKVHAEWLAFLEGKYARFTEIDVFRRAQAIEVETLLSGHLLCTQGDRVSMAHSVETRMPFLDPSLTCFSATRDAEATFFEQPSEKMILKEAYSAALPAEILHRTKFPFRAPDSIALLSSNRGPEFVRSYLTELNGLEGIIDVARASMFFEKCLSSGAKTPRDNFAFVLGLTILILHATRRRKVNTERLLSRHTVRRTGFGEVCMIANWN